MKTPAWAYVIGIMMMLVGGCGSIRNVWQIATPAMMDTQKEMMSTIYKNQPNATDTTITADSTIIIHHNGYPAVYNEETGKMMEKMFSLSDFQRTWIVRLGYIGFIPSILYILAGLFLFVRQRFSIKLAYIALVLSIVFTLVRTGVAVQGPAVNYTSIMSGFGSIFGIAFDIIFLVVIAVSDKSAYQFDNDSSTPKLT